MFRLQVFERRILRRFYGPRNDTHTGECRKRHNCDLEELSKRSDIAKEIENRRLTWAGHAW